MRTSQRRDWPLVGVLAVAVTFVIVEGCARRAPASAVKSRDQALIRDVVLNNMWRSGSPMECLAMNLRQGLSYRQALEACHIDLTGDTVGATLPGGIGDFPTVVPAGTPTPSGAACAALPGRRGFGPPKEDAGTDDDDLPPLPQPTTLQTLTNARADMLTLAQKLKEDGASPEVYTYVFLAANTFNGYIQQIYDQAKPPSGGKRTVQGFESPCQQVNAFFAQCDASNWKSSECRAMLDALNGCANSELSRTDGEQSCTLADPGLEEARAVIELECSKLARGTDGQNPCDRKLPKDITLMAKQLVIERCKPSNDTRATPDVPDTGDSKPGCEPASLEKFLDMVLSPKDFTFITSKIGGPQPPSGTDPIPR